jgi:hypothetical protein
VNALRGVFYKRLTVSCPRARFWNVIGDVHLCAPVLLVIEQQSGRRDESFLILWTDTFDRRFKFEKRCRLLVSTDDKSLPVVAVHSNIAFNFVNSSWMPSCMTVEA